MTALPSLKAHFSRSLAGGGTQLHLAAHSHHLWPDASFTGHMAAWQDAARVWDGKWRHVFGQVIPAAQRHIARLLNLPDPSTIAFAPNTHDFLRRLLSACPAGRPARVLTTDGEFHTLTRQLNRLREDGLVEATVLPVRPFATFAERFAQAAKAPFDLVFISQVFFNSGWALPDLASLVDAVASPDALVVIDGYHGFMARPTGLSAIQHRAFYLSGGYKYAMAGEGVCFMHCPPGIAPRPRDTGWYASFGALATAKPGEVPYGTDGSRFLGATFDPSGLYRFNAVQDWLAGLGIGVADIHAHAHAVAAAFVADVDRLHCPGLREARLAVPMTDSQRGNFLAYDSADSQALHNMLSDAGIVTDVRGSVLRIGFGVYHDIADVPGIVDRIAAAVT